MKNYKSILQDNEMYCWLCGRFLGAGGEWHHVFNAANKKRSERYGLMIKICRECHTQLHSGKENQMEKLKKRVQKLAMDFYGWSVEQFIKIFGKNYIL